MNRHLRVAVGQLALPVGALDANAGRIIDFARAADTQGAQLAVTPELGVIGYAAEDLLLRRRFVADAWRTTEHITAALADTSVVTLVGAPEETAPVYDGDALGRTTFNTVVAAVDGRIAARRHKMLLPDYSVFDETRYFAHGEAPSGVWMIGDVAVGLCICEDLWRPDGPAEIQAAQGAEILIVPNASPWYQGKLDVRDDLVAGAAARLGIPVLYVNLVGGQDELIFDGSSLLALPDEGIVWRAPSFIEHEAVLDIPVPARTGAAVEAVLSTRPDSGQPRPLPASAERLDTQTELWTALTAGVRDYMNRNGFPQMIIGLSGGLDSAVAACVAVDAIGADRVWGVALPGPYSSDISLADAKELADNLGVRFDVIPIGGSYDAILDAFNGNVPGSTGPFAGTAFNVAEENVQARLRGIALWGLTNKFGGITGGTGNASEIATGFMTLGADAMVGFGILGDVWKTEVFALARWRNDVEDVPGPIPARTIERPPSAELAPDQVDTNSLPPYEVLDAILRLYVDQDEDPAAIVAAGVAPAEIVNKVCQMVDRAEFKRRQLAPCLKVSAKSYGRDRRLPITNGYKPTVEQVTR